MFTKRGAVVPPDPQAGPTIPIREEPLPFTGPQQNPSFGLEEWNGDEVIVLTEEEVLKDPTLAERQLHAALTVRALKWLAFLKREEDDPHKAQAGRQPVTLDTQVAMFKVLTDWLKVSKKTKDEGGNDTGVVGIDQMRALIREEIGGFGAPEPRPRVVKERGAQPPTPSKTPTRREQANADDSELGLLLQRARERSYREPADGQ